jgi:hypothetical protein
VRLYSIYIKIYLTRNTNKKEDGNEKRRTNLARIVRSQQEFLGEKN